MRPDWNHLRNETAAAQLTFLDTEADTGITFARIALRSKDRQKISRNLASARKAYETICSHIAELPPHMPGLDNIHKKLATLNDMLRSLEKQT